MDFSLLGPVEAQEDGQPGPHQRGGLRRPAGEVAAEGLVQVVLFEVGE